MKSAFCSLLIWTLGLCGIIAGAVPTAAAESPAWNQSGLDALIEEGLSQNQSIRSMAAELEALRHRIPAAGALPDPKIGVGLLNMPTDTFSFEQEPMTQKQIAIEQQIPWLSKLDLETRSAALSAEIQAAMLKNLQLSIARQIAENWYQLGSVAYKQQINEQLIGMVTRIRRDMESRYVVGRGLQQDIYQAEVELSKLLEKQIMLENMRHTTEDRLNALLNRMEFEPVSPPEDIAVLDTVPDPGELTRTALFLNPDIMAQRVRMARAQTAVEMAEKDYYPDFNVRLAYGQREENEAGRDLADFVSATVMFDIPLWEGRKQDKLLSAALAEKRAAENAYENLVRRLPYEINAIVTELEDMLSRYRVYQEKLIPQAGQWARSALDAYEVGELEFDTMIQARIRELEIRQQAETLLYRLWQKQAALNALAGVPVQAGPTGTDVDGGTD